VPSMQHVVSRDGTRIAYEKTGSGPSLIITGGSLGDHRFYVPLARELARHFTVYNFDRRGRGQSGDTQPYSVDREVDDVAALIADAGRAVFVYGHSAGSALALRAAAAGLDIARLALADPPYRRRGEAEEKSRARFAEQAATVAAFHDKGDHHGAAAYFLGGFGLSPGEVEQMLHSPAGEEMVDSARALPYDIALLGDGLLPEELAATVRVPTLVMTDETAPETARALVRVMPDARLQPMPASAHDLAPADIAATLVPFFTQR
jgi:pimeloyl-ACP methyl ester carboxylesterase